MEKMSYKPYVPEKTDMKELTFKALFIGVILAVILGAANAYLGLRAGMTVAATFPAAVVAMAFLRIFKGNILEENLARTTASVGEALVAGAIFTIPAFIIAGVWDDLKIFDTIMIMMIGGVLGVLFVIILRRPLVTNKDLQFPESIACAEIVKAGQKGSSGANLVFGAAGLSALIQLCKDTYGFQFIREYKNFFFNFSQSKMQFLDGDGKNLGEAFDHQGGMYVSSPSASPAFLGVGYIIGTRLASITFSGGVFGWLMLIPLLLFINSNLGNILQTNPDASWTDVGRAVWYFQVRPIAVGAMIVGAVFTLWKMKNSLIDGIGKALTDMKTVKAGGEKPSRYEDDLPLTWMFVFIVVLVIPMAILYYYFSHSVMAAVVAAIVMTLAGFFFSAVAGYLVGIIGSSSNPISGLTLSTLLIAALLMVFLGVRGPEGVAAVLGVAAVVCCVAGIAGDMMQDLKVGHILGGTPRKMEIAEIIGVIFAALIIVFPLIALHKVYGFGSEELPAPQAGLMAMIAKGIVGGDMAWPLIIAGMFFAIGLILIKSPSPMLIAVGMYLPLHTTFAIFVGGVVKWIFEKVQERKKLSDQEKEDSNNKGLLVASGLVAGESLIGIFLALLVLAKDKGWVPWTVSDWWSASPEFVNSAGFWIGLLGVIPLLGFILIWLPLKKEKA